MKKSAKAASRPKLQRRPKSNGNNHHDANVDQILGSAATLFAEKSFGLASVREIAAHANISFPRIYYYLRNKEELLYLVSKRGMERLITTYAERSAGVTDPGEKLRLFIENQYDQTVSRLAEAKVLLYETDKLSEPYLREIRALERQYSQTCRAILTELAHANGQELERARGRVLSSLLFGSLNSLHAWYDPARDAARRQPIIDEIYRLFAGAVR